jgi:CubicO group peptidase (beta-lactamase class C family)
VSDNIFTPLGMKDSGYDQARRRSPDDAAGGSAAVSDLPRQVGQDAKRYYSFDDAGRLSLATPPTRRADGRTMSTVLISERL